MAMEFEKAKAIATKHAKEYDEVVNYAEEYGDAYMFSDNTSDEIGGFLPCVVMKETGELLPFHIYLDETSDSLEAINTYTI